MKENNTNITKKSPVNIRSKKAKNFIDGAGQLRQAMNDTAQAVTESANAVTRISEHMNEQEEQFLAAHRSPARDLKRQVLEDAIDKGDISNEEALKALTEMQKEDADETVKLMDAKARSNNAQGNKVWKIGAGVGAGTIGTGILIWIISSIFGGNNDKSA